MQRSERIAKKVDAYLNQERPTKKDIAIMLGMSRPALDRRLAGTVAWTYEELERLGDILDMTVEMLVHENNENGTSTAER